VHNTTAFIHGLDSSKTVLREKKKRFFSVITKIVIFPGRSASCLTGLEVKQFVGGGISKLGKPLGHGEERAEVDTLSASLGTYREMERIMAGITFICSERQ